jgi:DNA primase
MGAPPSRPSGLLAEVRSRISLTSLVGRDANLERRGRLHVACCPFHAEKTPSFTVYEDGHYHCFGCQAHGDAIDYVRQRDGLAFRAAVAALATEVGMVLPNGDTPDSGRRRAARDG